MQKGTGKILLCFSAVMMLAVMPGSEVQESAEAKSAALSAKTKALRAGESFTLRLKNTKKTGRLSIESGKEKITASKQKITVKGKKKTVRNQWAIKGKKKGKAVITVKIGKKKLKCRVTVKKAMPELTMPKVPEVSTPAEAQTVALTEDRESFAVSSGEKIILDMNGHTIENNTADDAVTVEKGGFLWIKGSGRIVNTTGGTAVFNNGTCLISNVSIECRTSDYTVINHGQMQIASGSVKSSQTRKACLVENGYYDGDGTGLRTSRSSVNAAEPALTVSGGTFRGGKASVKNDDYGHLYITGGDFGGSWYCSVKNWNRAYIYGGTFSNRESCISNGRVESKSSAGILKISGGVFKDSWYLIMQNAYSADDAIGDVSISRGGAKLKNIYEYAWNEGTGQKGNRIVWHR